MLDRANTKMLVFNMQQIYDAKLKEISNFLPKNCLLVFNDAKVIKAKLQAIIARNNAILDFNLNQQINNDFISSKFTCNQHKTYCETYWNALCKPAKKVKIGDILQIATNFSGEVVDKNNDGIITIAFKYNQAQLQQHIANHGQMPLPPYIKSTENQQHYQTIYAKNGTAVAAPTAGLHFDQQMFAMLAENNIQTAFLTLNVGAGTFLPVKTAKITDHNMHSESFSIDENTCNIINQAKKQGRKIIAVGTTSLRVLETIAKNKTELEPTTASTNIFIYPPYNFRIVDGLFTNFHLPKSTLFMLVSAFIGLDMAKKTYQHAIDNNYRFYSYGDASLLMR